MYSEQERNQLQWILLKNDQLEYMCEFGISCMVVYTCEECGELNYLTPHAFWKITDFGAKCPKCNVTNTIALEKGELKKQELS